MVKKSSPAEAVDEVGEVEETLDPEDWEGMRDLGHRMVDEVIDYLRSVRERPVWTPIPTEVRDRFREPAPQD